MFKWGCQKSQIFCYRILGAWYLYPNCTIILNTLHFLVALMYNLSCVCTLGRHIGVVTQRVECNRIKAWSELNFSILLLCWKIKIPRLVCRALAWNQFLLRKTKLNFNIDFCSLAQTPTVPWYSQSTACRYQLQAENLII